MPGRAAPAGAEKDQLIGQVIERASEVLQGVASHGGQNRRRLSDARNVVDESSRLRITLGPDYVWTGLVEGLNRGLQVANVLPALFDLHQDARESFFGGTSA